MPKAGRGGGSGCILKIISFTISISIILTISLTISMTIRITLLIQCYQYY